MKRNIIREILFEMGIIPSEDIMLIISRGVTQESIGRIRMKIDSMKKVVEISVGERDVAPDQSELELVKKYLRYHHPEIVNKAGIMTGWAIRGEIQL